LAAFALAYVDQPTADKVIQQVIEPVLTISILRPLMAKQNCAWAEWMPKIREDFFLGCKTMARSKQGAINEFHESLARLQVDMFDLYQLHAVTSMDELDQCTRTVAHWKA
jgi:hypothetical protein